MRHLTLNLLAAVGVASLTAPAAAAAAAESKKETSIPFIEHAAIRDWQADGRDGLWIEDSRGRWYYAKTLGPCIGLDTAWSIALDARPAGTFDKFGVIILPGNLGRCNLTSLTESTGPTKQQRKPKPKKPAADSATQDPADRSAKGP